MASLPPEQQKIKDELSRLQTLHPDDHLRWKDQVRMRQHLQRLSVPAPHDAAPPPPPPRLPKPSPKQAPL